MSEVPKVYKAIANVMSALSKEGISKDRKNQAQGYSFRGIDDVYQALSGLLSANDLVIIPRVQSHRLEERETAKGGRMAYSFVDVEFDLVSAEDGTKHTARTTGEGMDSADKSTNKAMSAAYKYMAFQVFCIPVEGDNDADSHTHEVKPVQRQQAPQTQSTPQQSVNDTGKLAGDYLKTFTDSAQFKEFKAFCDEDNISWSKSALDAKDVNVENFIQLMQYVKEGVLPNGTVRG